MKILLLSIFLLCATSDSTQVYICTGSTAYAYHKTTNCRGLKRCTGEIKKTSIEQAKKENRKACKLCYKKR